MNSSNVDWMNARYPGTRMSDQVDDYHGTTIADPYRWLEDDRSPETMAWVEQQNAVTEAYLGALPMREAFAAALRARWNSPRITSLSRRGDRWFFLTNDGLQNQDVLCMSDGFDGKAVVVLDPNELSEDGTRAMTFFAPSPTGSLVAYGVSDAGSDWLVFHIRDVNTGLELADTIRWIKFSSVSWTEDERGFYYSRYPQPSDDALLTAPNVNQELRYHRLGSDQSEDILVLSYPDHPRWMIGAAVLEGGRWLIVTTRGDNDNNALFVGDLGNPVAPNLAPELCALDDSFDARHTVAGVDGNRLYVLTNREAPLGRVVSVDLESHDLELHQVIGPGPKSIALATIAGDRILVDYTDDASSRLFSFDLEGAPVGEVDIPALGTVSGLTGRRNLPEAIVAYSNFVQPMTFYRLDVATGTLAPFRDQQSAFNREDYVVERQWAVSRDGTHVPTYVIRRTGTELDGSNPTILTGYGGFNVSLTPTFSMAQLVWVELGGIAAVACLRGGGEYGEEWHRSGTLERKQNVFDDFIAAATMLCESGYASAETLALRGGSNGGLLVAAVMNQRPDLAACVVTEVGVHDMLRYHLFTVGRAWSSDYGLSDDPELFPILLAYSPLHNLRDGVKYPAVLVLTGDHDDRVVPAHSFKYAARLQACNPGARPGLIRIERRSGHGAGRSTSVLIESSADVFAFVRHHTAVRGADEDSLLGSGA